jgi:hypothetical protein
MQEGFQLAIACDLKDQAAVVKAIGSIRYQERPGGLNLPCAESDASLSLCFRCYGASNAELRKLLQAVRQIKSVVTS